MNLLEKEMVELEVAETEFSHRWQEKDSIIYLSVTSDGTTGPEWIRRWQRRYNVSGDAHAMLQSDAFQPTSGVTYHLAMVKNPTARDIVPKPWTLQKANEIAHKHGFGKLHPEVACLLRDQFTSDDLKSMGVKCIVTMHSPLKDRGGNLHVLRSNPYGMDSLFRKCSGVRCRTFSVAYSASPALN